MNKKDIPLVKGGQGRSEEEVVSSGSIFGIVAIVLILTAIIIAYYALK